MADNSLTPKEEFLLNPVTEHNITDAAIATFETNLRHPLKVEIPFGPKQDLHGYDHPWPGGGSINLLPTAESKTQNGVSFSVQNDGSIVISGTATAIASIDIGRGKLTLPTGLYRYDYNAGAITGVSTSVWADGSPATNLLSGTGLFTVNNESSVFVRIAITSGTTVNFTAYPMITAGKTSAAYVPYENLCPISGYTGAEIEQAGKNLFDKDNPLVFNGYVTSQSAFIAGSNFRTVVVRVKPNTTYTISKVAANVFSVCYASVQPSVGTIGAGSIVSQTAESITITTGADAKYLWVYVKNVNTVYTDAELYASIQVEEGSTATDYEPYTGNQISVTFPASVGDNGIVYSGSHEVATGKLKSTMGMVDLGTLTWSYNAQNKIFYRALDGASSNVNNIICSQYKVFSTWAELIADTVRAGIYKSYDANHSLYIRDTRYTDPSAFRNALSGVQLCYELATPTEYTLTPQPMTAFYGTNNIWSDIGNVNVKYLTQNSDTGMEYRGDRALELRRRAMLADAPTIHTTVGSSATGGLASFKSYIKAPVKKIEIPFGPVQDLHGYDHPWPAGGGKNLFGCADGTYAVGATRTINVNNQVWEYVANTSASSYVFLPEATVNEMGIKKLQPGTYTFSLASNALESVVIASAVLNLSDGQTVTNGNSFTVSEETSVVSITTTAHSAYVRGTYSCNIQIELGSTATAWTPYSNDCPISGHTGLTVTRTGKNLLSYSINRLSGSIRDVTLDKTRAVFLRAGQTYTLSFDMQNATSWRIAIISFDVAGNRLWSEQKLFGAEFSSNMSGRYYVWPNNQSTKTVIISPVYDCYAMLFFSLGDTSESTVMTDQMLELGSTATAYAPYTGNQISVTWQTEAGTVYGSKLTLNSDRTGTLVVDKGLADLSDFTWGKSSSYRNVFVAISNMPTRWPVSKSDSTIADLRSSSYGATSWIDLISNEQDAKISYRSSGSGKGCAIRDSTLSAYYDNFDLAAFKAAISGRTVLYPLATPQTIQLTTSEVSAILTALYGTNNIWCDISDDITVKYWNRGFGN